MNTDEMFRLYRSGLTVAKIAAIAELSSQAVSQRLRRGEPRYKAAVTRNIIKRIVLARASGERKKENHAIWCLRRFRPEAHKRWLNRGKPKLCSSCGEKIQAELVERMWVVRCNNCGESRRNHT